MQMMSVTVLVDNNTLTDRYFAGEPGISLYIETGSKKILFDTGYSDLFLKNAMKMKLEMLDLDFVVLSHGHIDHTGGLFHLLQAAFEARIEGLPYRDPTLITHPFCFYPRRMEGSFDIGSPVSRDVWERSFPICLSDRPVWLTDDLVFLGEIERTNGFEYREPMGRLLTPEGERPDTLVDDSALAFRSEDGLVILTGCSHSGICNIIEYARKVCGEERVCDVIGGFHLLSPDPGTLAETCACLQKLAPKAMHPCHCTDLGSKVAISRVAPVHETGVGLTLKYG